jgi:glycosyltransferase involved in cell wall biosynthesis
MNVLFYSPFVRPHDAVASGAARMANLLIRALEGADMRVQSPHLPLTFDATCDVAYQARAQAASLEAADALLAAIRAGRMARPDIFFSYHVYYKSPDWIGPRIAAALGIPYVVAEGSHAPKRAVGAWANAHAAATAALSAARLHLAMTAFDRYCIEQLCPGRVHDLKPFIDTEAFSGKRAAPSNGTRLLTVSMMRSVRKRDSHALIAEALRYLPAGVFTLDIAGDGDHREEIERLYDPVTNRLRVRFLGAQTPAQVQRLMLSADMLVWPGIGEAYGLVYLEAQACGLPVVACRNRGVPDVTMDGVSAILSAPGDVAGLGVSIMALHRSEAMRRRLSDAGQAFVRTQRSLVAASARLRELLGAAG